MSSSNSPVSNFFGGSPIAVIGKLILLSIIVGVIMAVLGLDARTLIIGIGNLVEDVFGLGFDAFHKAFQYFLIGAVIVIPIWLLTRIFAKR